MKRGFTLVELLVVISIMSILTIITVGQFNTARKKARDVQRKGDLNAMSKALQMYFADYGEFPGGIFVGGGEFRDNTGYVYMKVMPEEKTPNMPDFCYVVSDDRKSFGLFAMLENTEDSDCHMTGAVGDYSHCGETYCYSVVSQNIIVDDLTSP